MGVVNLYFSSAQNIANADDQLTQQNTKEGRLNKSCTAVTITCQYTEPDFIDIRNILIIEGVSVGEYVVIKIEGKIIDFKHIKLGWDNEKGGLIEEKVLNKINAIENQTIVISTYIPEGIPVEKIKWKSIKDKEYDFIIQEDGTGEKIKEFKMD